MARLADDTRSSPPSADSRVFLRGVRVLWVSARAEPLVFWIAVAGSLLHAAVGVALASVLGYVTDSVLLPAFEAGETTPALLGGAVALLLGVGVLRALGLGARRFFAGLHQYRMQAHYRRKVARRYLRLPLSWHHRHPAGQLLSNANADVEASWAPLAPLPMTIGSVAMLLIAGGAMIVTDPVLAAVGFVVFPAVAVANIWFQRRVTPVASRAQALRAEVSEVAHESFDGAVVVKTLGREDTETQRFATSANRLRDIQIRVGRLRGMFDPVMEALPNLGVLAVLLVGMWRLSTNAVDPGDIVEIAYLFTLLSMPVRSLGMLLGDIPRSVVGWDRVQRVLGARGEMPHGSLAATRDSGGAAVTLTDVAFSYPDAYRADSDTGQLTRDLAHTEDGESVHTQVLHDVTVAVGAGRTVALVGPTGSGKSTLASLLVRLVDPDEGHVALDGIDVRDMRQGEMSRLTALVPQATFIFDDTVRGNIALGLDVGDDEIWHALRIARADGFVAELPRGLDTSLGERGTSLSGGQRQRLVLARAAVRRPRLLVLDDATSAVDPRVEGEILAGLREAAAGATLVVVAYRRATIELADEVIYMEDGMVRARGAHRDLLAGSPGYRELVTAYERAAEEREAPQRESEREHRVTEGDAP